MQTKMFIDGGLVAGQGEALAVLDPARGRELCRIAEATPEQVAAAVAAADRALPGWARTAPKDRAAVLLKIADPLFNRNGGGSSIPIKIEGSRSEPKFGLDVHRVFNKDSKS